jgi:uncharacterized membrane protein
MELTSSASSKAALWFLVALAAVSVVRAMTQSVTPGEAWNYVRYIAPPWAESLSRFDVNNHVLNTLFVRISTSRFHLTELSMRLPSLLAGVLYLCIVYRLARRWFGDGAGLLAVVGLLTLNPVVMDAMSEARGYGMALALWLLALELILQCTQRFDVRKLNLAAVCLGLTVAASLAFAAPACALLLISELWFRGERDLNGRRAFPATLMFLTMFVLLAIPANRAQCATLGIGAMILQATFNFDSPLLYAAIVMSATLSGLFFLLVTVAERLIIRWHPEDTSH